MRTSAQFIDQFQEQVAVVTTVKIGIGDKIGITEGDDIWAGIRDTASVPSAFS